MLSIVQSPYSPDFNSAFLPLVQNHEITGPLVNADMTDPVSIFIGIYLCILLSPNTHRFSPSYIEGNRGGGGDGGGGGGGGG